MSLLVSRDERVLILTLDRAEKRNALDSRLCHEIVDAVESADDAVGAILLDARGEVFCAGMDLEEVSGPEAAAKTAIHEQLFTLGARVQKPIVAAVNGPALGGGLGLVANAHVVVAAHGASFGLTEIRVGMWPFVIWRAVAAALGERRTMWLALSSRVFSVNEAVQWGLVHEVAQPVELDDRAFTIAKNLSESSPQAIRLGMEFVQRSGDPLEYRAKAFASEDFREGVAAFREKRRPVWNRNA